MGSLNHAPPHFLVQDLSFRDKISLATAFARSLGPMPFAGSPHDLGKQITDSFLGSLGSGRSLTTTLENPRGTSEQCLLPMMDHGRMDLMSGRQY